MGPMFPRVLLFLSTPSARRATGQGGQRAGKAAISIHALREEGDKDGSVYDALLDISIHALREEGDRMGQRSPGSIGDFYPRPPRGGRHVCKAGVYHIERISIHALREEGDATLKTAPTKLNDFYPRPPRGGRPLAELL